jgi:nucleoside phosphorylase
MSTRPVLVLSAWEPELTALRAAIASSPALRRGVVARPAGVGLVESAIGATRAIAEVKPRAVIFVGTAGVFGRGLPLASAVVARRIQLVSTAVLRAQAFFPAPLPTTVNTDARLRRALRLPMADVACPLAITRTPAAARRLVTTGCQLETLEAFAVARAAAPLPFAAVLGLSNQVGPTGHAQWRTHAAAASAAACAAVLAWLARG